MLCDVSYPNLGSWVSRYYKSHVLFFLTILFIRLNEFSSFPASSEASDGTNVPEL